MTYAHREIAALMPWYINGSIGERDRQSVETHLEQCAGCRQELALERRIYEGMNAETAVEYMPAASLKRLQARLDGALVSASADQHEVQEPADARKPGRWSMPWQGLAAASVAVAALVIGLSAAGHWGWFRAHPAQADYYTVTTPASHAPGEVIRAVFAPSVTLVELQAILDEAQLRIVSGPTEAGVYSLAANSHRPVSSSLALLRGHAKVRFAESIESNSGPDNIP
jgi:anti-sigma factor RsiW